MNSIKTVFPQTSPLCFMPDGKLVCYQHGDIVVIEENVEEVRIPLFYSPKERIVGKLRLLNRLLRLGIRAAETIDDSNILFSIANRIYELDIKKGILSKGYNCGAGIRPLVFTKSEGIEEIDDGIYFGEYLDPNANRCVNIYRRKGVDAWEVVYTYKKGEVNHIHNIIPDPYRNCLWIFTGDFDKASAIWKVSDNFNKVERVLYNDQKYRGCVAFALPEGLLYATDAPFADDYIYLLNPDTLKVEELLPIDGSCIYGCKWKENFIFSTTVEGDGRNTSRMEFYFGRKRGAGIKDEYVHMYMGNLKDGFRELYKAKKDCMPYYTFQFGVFKFPAGVNNTDYLFFQPVATKNNDQDLMMYSE